MYVGMKKFLGVKKNSIDKAYLVVGIVQPKMFFGENLSVLCFTAGFLFGLRKQVEKNLIYATYTHWWYNRRNIHCRMMAARYEVTE